MIKNKEDEPLERFVFALRSIIEVQGYDKDRRLVFWYTVRSQLMFGFAVSKTPPLPHYWASTSDRSCRD